MKKIIMILMLIMLVGCSKTYVCTDGTTVDDLTKCPVAQPQPTAKAPEAQVNAPIEVIEVEVKMDSKIQGLLDKFENLKSLSYYHHDTDRDRKFNVIVNDKYMKYTYGSVQWDLPIEIEGYDNMYFDLVNKKAWATCEHPSKCNAYKNELEIDFDKFYVETPFERVKEITTDAKIIENKQCDANKRCEIIKFGNVEMGIWDYKGVPIYIKGNGESLEFQDLSYNSASDDDFEFIINK